MICCLHYQHLPTGRSPLERSTQDSSIERTGSGPPLTVKNVVTVFLSYHGRVLLLRRSDRVGSYRGRWAGISGYVEQHEDPLNRALKEISEEVNLTRDEVSLAKMGQPLPALDENLHTLWVVHPFLFLTSHPRINLNWEHDAYRWTSTKDLHSFETVPKLEEALDRLLEDTSILHSLETTVLTRFTEIREDRVHGASELSRQSLRAMKLLTEQTAATTPEDLLKELRVFGRELMNSRPNMAPLTNLVGRLVYVIAAKAKRGCTVQELRDTVASTCERILEESERAVHEIAVRASDLVQNRTTVFTHSLSETVSEALKTAAKMGREIRVIVTESRPLFEGRAAAQELSSLGIPVTLVVDSAIGYLIEGADLCFVGADSVLSDGSVVNKIGTFPLALSAREHNKPFYVLCEKSKFNLRSMFEAQREIEERNWSEVLPCPSQPLLTVRSPYFDTTPSRFVSRLITEDGAVSSEELPRLFMKMLGETYL